MAAKGVGQVSDMDHLYSGRDALNRAWRDKREGELDGRIRFTPTGSYQGFNDPLGEEDASSDGMIHIESVTAPFKARHPWMHKALIAGAVVLGILALLVAAGVAIHFTVGLQHAWQATQNFFAHELTVNQGLLMFGLPVAALVVFGVPCYKGVQKLRSMLKGEESDESSSPIPQKRGFLLRTGSVTPESEKGTRGWFDWTKRNSVGVRRVAGGEVSPVRSASEVGEYIDDGLGGASWSRSDSDSD